MTELMQTTAGAQFGTARSAAPWMEAFEQNTRAWLNACTGIARMYASASEALAELASEMMKFWLQAPRLADFPTANLLCEGLMMAEQQAERTADAARQTLADMGERSTSVPIPLPE